MTFVWWSSFRVLVSSLETTISQPLNKIFKLIQKHIHRTENEVFARGYIMNKLNNKCGNHALLP